MRSGILAVAFGCCLAVMEQQPVQSKNANQNMTAPGVKTLPSHYSVHETVNRLEGLLKSKGIRIFARIDQAAEAQAIASAVASAPRIKDPAGNLFIESLLNAACARILHTYAEVRYRLSGPPRLTDDQLRRAIDYIHDHIGEALDLGSISRAAGLSAFHFARLFKAATGVSPFQFVTRTRMERAKELLRKTRLPISDIAERVGYRQPSHFSARFRSVLGCRPDAYRQRRGGGREDAPGEFRGRSGSPGCN